MIKKILTVTICVLLAGCSMKTTRTIDFTDAGYMPESTVAKTKTAVILPLSGESAALGDAFRNAILMAQLDRSTDEVTEVDFYDSKGTIAGAKNAFLAAKRADADMYINKESIKKKYPEFSRK